jgi:hypothetical protein
VPLPSSHYPLEVFARQFSGTLERAMSEESLRPEAFLQWDAGLMAVLVPYFKSALNTTRIPPPRCAKTPCRAEFLRRLAACGTLRSHSVRERPQIDL